MKNNYLFIGLIMAMWCGCSMASELEDREVSVRPEIQSGSLQPDKVKKQVKSMEELQSDHAIIITWILASEENAEYFFPIAEAAMSRYVDYRTSCGADWKSERLPLWFHVMSMYAESSARLRTDAELAKCGVSNPHTFRQMMLAGNLDRLRKGNDEAPSIPDEKLLEFMTELAIAYESERPSLDTPPYARADVVSALQVFAMFMHLNEVCGSEYPNKLRRCVYICLTWMKDEELREMVRLFFEQDLAEAAVKLDMKMDNAAYDAYIRKLKSDIKELYRRQ